MMVVSLERNISTFAYSMDFGDSIFLDMVGLLTEWTVSLLEAAWCFTNIAAGKPEETKALLTALPLLIAHLGG
ncbi:unnamed protein product [Camellia sinensis]